MRAALPACSADLWLLRGDGAFGCPATWRYRPYCPFSTGALLRLLCMAFAFIFPFIVIVIVLHIFACHLARVKRTDLDKARTFVGTCPDMCPEKERYMRETRSQLSVFEVVPGTDQVKPPDLSRLPSIFNLQGGGGIYIGAGGRSILCTFCTYWYLIWVFTFVEGGRDLECGYRECSY